MPLDGISRRIMKPTLESAISSFGVLAKQKLSNPSTTGEPEDQLRAPFEQLLKDMADLSGFLPKHVTAVGETSLSDLKTRPDYSITVQNALVGFVELKAPGKGADPTRFRDAHDKSQWQKLSSLPNLLYTDGNQFSLWQNGELVDAVLTLDGDIASSGDKPPALAPRQHPTRPLAFGIHHRTHNLLNILALLVDLEPKQKELLERILANELISESELTDTGAFAVIAASAKNKTESQTTPDLFD